MRSEFGDAPRNSMVQDMKMMTIIMANVDSDVVCIGPIVRICHILNDAMFGICELATDSSAMRKVWHRGPASQPGCTSTHNTGGRVFAEYLCIVIDHDHTGDRKSVV